VFLLAPLVILLGGAALANMEVKLSDPPLKSSERRALAKRLLEGFETLRQQLPTLSPAQQEWLSAETKQAHAAEHLGISNRHFALMATQEHALHVVHSHLGPLVSLLTKLSEPLPADERRKRRVSEIRCVAHAAHALNVDLPPLRGLQSPEQAKRYQEIKELCARKYATLRREVFYWSAVAAVICESNFWGSLYILVSKGVIEPSALEFVAPGWNSHETLLFLNAVHHAETILRNIVAPYLDESLPISDQ
jgi:hypothetical protein